MKLATGKSTVNTTLKKGSVGTLEGVFQSFSFVGPAADVAILLVGTFFFAGISSTITVIIAWLIYGLWMITPYEFSKYKSNAGSYYAYAAGSTKSGVLGPITVFSWMYENLTGPSFGILGLSGFLFLISTTISNIPYLWIVFAVVITVYMIVLPYLGIKPSLQYVAITGIIETLVLVIGAIIIIVKVGPTGNSFLPFTIPSGTLGAVLFGVIFSIVDFTGLGTVTTVSEEIKDPKKKVRKSLILAWAVAGLALIPATYALTVGWGVGNISQYAGSPDPGLIVYGKYLGPIGLALLAIFTVNSYFSYGVAKTNAVSRIWFSAARDGVIFPKFFAKVHPKYRTPGNAMIGWISIVFVIDLVFGLVFGPVNGALILLTGAGIGIIFVHVLANTSLTLYSHNLLRHRGESNALYHYVAPTASSVIGLIIIFYSLQSEIQAYLADKTGLNLAYLLAVIVGLVWVLVVGSLLSLYYHTRRKEIIQKAGEYDSESAEAS